MALIVLFFAPHMWAQKRGAHRNGRHGNRRQEFSLQPRSHLDARPQGILFFNTFGSNYIGFGGEYFFRPFAGHSRLGFSIDLIPYPQESFPDVNMYYDPYYDEYIYYQSPNHRTRTLFSIFALFRQRLFAKSLSDEMQPYLIFGAGPLLAYESVPRQSILHSKTQVTVAGLAGFGVNYRLGGWFINADLRYQLTHFPRPIYNKRALDSWIFKFGVGRYF